MVKASAEATKLIFELWKTLGFEASSFTLQWNATENYCGGEIFSDMGTIMSPNYPEVGFNVVLKLNRVRLQTPKNYDSLWVLRGRLYDFTTKKSPHRRGTFLYSGFWLSYRIICKNPEILNFWEKIPKISQFEVCDRKKSHPKATSYFKDRIPGRTRKRKFWVQSS